MSRSESIQHQCKRWKVSNISSREVSNISSWKVSNISSRKVSNILNQEVSYISSRKVSNISSRKVSNISSWKCMARNREVSNISSRKVSSNYRFRIYQAVNKKILVFFYINLKDVTFLDNRRRALFTRGQHQKLTP